MVVKPRFRGFICTTAHPEGCAKLVEEQISYVKKQGPFQGPKKALVIGSSTGYGLASRITATFGAGADTLGIFFERPASEKRTATAGWYNSAAFERIAQKEGYYAKSLNGDAFSHEVKQQTIDLIKQDLGQIDLVVYSLAAPVRIHPETGEKLKSVIKPIGQPFTSKTVDFHTGEVDSVSIEPATEEEIEQTIGVMGGEDWQLWIEALQEAAVLAEGAKTVAYTYIGPSITHPIYREGTIGRAKDHLEKTAHVIQEKMQSIQGDAFISVNKALVTQASSAIPVIPLYISLLYQVMKQKGYHEGCIEQMYRLFEDQLYGKVRTDTEGRIRVDNYELREEVQQQVIRLWEQADTSNLPQLADLEGFRSDFFQLFGFHVPGVNYEQEVTVDVPIHSIT